MARHGVADADRDGVPDHLDRCLGFDDHRDADRDGIPNGCDFCAGYDDRVDSDLDGFPDGCDVCAGADDDSDADGDGIPDGCDRCEGYLDAIDEDYDGVPDRCDLCNGFDDGADQDGDGTPDGCDRCAGANDAFDADRDGVADGCDACPGFPDERLGLEDLVLCDLDDALSVDIRDVPLARVLTALEERFGIRAELPAGGADQPVRVAFDELPFEEGLRRILHGYSFVVQLAPLATSRAGRTEVVQVTQLRILQPERTVDAWPVPAPPQAPMSIRVARTQVDLEVLVERAYDASEIEGRRQAVVALLETAKAAEDPAVRAAALAHLTDIEGGSRARLAVERGLRDEAPEVRQVAARALRDLPLRE